MSGLVVPALECDRVRLRAWDERDAPTLAAAWLDPDVARWTAVPDDHSEVAARRWIAGDASRRARGIALDLVITPAGAPGSVAGEVGLGPIQWEARRAAMGFWLMRDRRGSGLAAAAVGLLSGWALAALELDQVVAESAVDNPASGRVLTEAGFHLTIERGDRQVWIRTGRS